MSWILGAVGRRIDDKIIESINGLSKESNIVLKSSQLILYSGGIKETCHFKITSESPAQGWFVSGIGIDDDGHNFKLMSKNDWSSFFSKSIDEKKKQLDGHYITIHWNENEVIFHTDQLGLRQLFFTEIGHSQFAFSTRLDWISKLNKKSIINFHEFGSQWLLQNKLSLNSTVTEIIRISQGGKAKFKHSKLSTFNQPWMPSMEADSPINNHISILEKLTLLPLKNGNNLSLALSGGLDSRVLLSILLSSDYKDWSLHSLHNLENQDIKIPRLISSKLEIEHQFIEDNVPDVSECISLLNNFIGHTQAVSPASNMIGFQFYKKLYRQNKIVIDGGLGEIARRRYLNRLLISGKKALLDGDVHSIRPYLELTRAPIFNKEVMLIMEEGVNSQISNFIASMPNIKEMAIENWLDLMAIRTRFTNLAALEQSRADTEIVTFMPFAQPTFLRSMFAIPVSERRNGKFFKQIIRKNEYLSRIPLVKDGVIYPFSFPTIASSIYLKLRRKYGKIFKDNISDLFLEKISEYVLDTLYSSSVKNCGYYSYNFLVECVNAYYKGDYKYNSLINWWLSFEIFRQQVSDKK